MLEDTESCLCPSADSQIRNVGAPIQWTAGSFLVLLPPHRLPQATREVAVCPLERLCGKGLGMPATCLFEFPQGHHKEYVEAAVAPSSPFARCPVGTCLA